MDEVMKLASVMHYGGVTNVDGAQSYRNQAKRLARYKLRFLGS